MGAQRRDDLIDSEPRGVGVGEHARGEGAQPSFVLARRAGLRRRGADEGSDAASRLDDSGTLELRVDARDRVRVDAQIDGELADRGQLVARAQTARSDCRAESAFELRVNRRLVARINRNEAHLNSYTSSLVQCGQQRKLGGHRPLNAREVDREREDRLTGGDGHVLPAIDLE